MLFWTFAFALLELTASLPAYAQQQPAPGEAFRDCGQCPEMVAVPAGEYLMGASEEDRKFPHVQYHIPSELPQHKVSLAYSFGISRHVVTVAEFAAFVDETGHAAGGECLVRLPDFGPNKGKFIGKVSANAGDMDGRYGAVLLEHADFRLPGSEVTDNHPATCISRKEAKAYLEWLARKSGRKYRLPTEAEWEYAVRAGETRPFYFGGGLKELCAYANFADRDSVYNARDAARCAEKPSLEGALPVGGFRPNNWGLLDMVGNVFQFTEDCYFPNYEGAPTDGSPWTTSEVQPAEYQPDGACAGWTTRGYLFDSIDVALRSAARCQALTSEDERSNALGLRVAVSLDAGAWDLK